MEMIKIAPGFCPNCGSILPNLRATGKVKCYNCLTDWPPEGKILLCAALFYCTAFSIFCFGLIFVNNLENTVFFFRFHLGFYLNFVFCIFD